MSCYRFKSIGVDWEFKLMFVVCKWNFCKVFRYGKTKDKNMIFFGKEENMETVKWLYNMLCERFEKFGGYQKGRAMPSAKHDSCYAYGVKDGKNTQINKQVETSTKAQASKVKLLK